MIFFFLRFWWQAWALAHSPAHNVNKHSPAVQYVWFGWHWGLGRSLMLHLLLSSFSSLSSSHFLPPPPLSGNTSLLCSLFGYLLPHHTVEWGTVEFLECLPNVGVLECGSYTANWVLACVYCTLYSVSVLATVWPVQCTMYSVVLYTMNIGHHYTVYYVHCTVLYCVLCTLYSTVQWAMYSTHRTKSTNHLLYMVYRF